VPRSGRDTRTSPMDALQEKQEPDRDGFVLATQADRLAGASRPGLGRCIKDESCDRHDVLK